MGFRDWFRKDPEKEIPEQAGINLFKTNNINNIYTYYSSQYGEDDIINRIGGREKLSKILCDDEVCAALDTRQDACVSTPWQVSGGEDEVNKFITDALFPHVRKAARCFWQSVPYGYSVTEVVYKVDLDGVKIKTVIDKPIEWFKIYNDGTHSYIGNYGDTEVKADPLKYIFTVRKPTYKNPMGDALLAKLFWPYYFRTHSWEFWFSYIEKFANPLLHGKTAPNKESLKALLEQLEAVRNSSAIATDKDTEVNVLSVSARNQEFASFEETLVSRIQKSVLGQTLTSQVGSSGSFAAAKVHNYVRDDKRRSDCKLLEESFNVLIENLFHLNGFEGEIPEFKMEDKTDLGLDRAERDAKLVAAGMIQLTEQYIRDRYDFNEGDFILPQQSAIIDEDIVLRAQHNGEIHHDHLDLAQKYTFAANKIDDDALEKLIRDAMEGTTQPVNVEKIRDVVLASKNPKDLAKNLADVYQSSDGKFEDNLTNALFAAKILGYLGEAP